MTKLTWDNAVAGGPGDGGTRKALKTEDMVSLELNGRNATAARLDPGWTSRSTQSRCFSDTGVSRAGIAWDGRWL